MKRNVEVFCGVPDRVIDAPIPEDLQNEYNLAGVYGKYPFSTEFVRILIERIARLEAEKQEAHTEGWNACVKKMAELCLEWVNSVSCEPGTACKCQRTADAIRQRALDWTKPTAAKQGDPS